VVYVCYNNIISHIEKEPINIQTYRYIIKSNDYKILPTESRGRINNNAVIKLVENNPTGEFCDNIDKLKENVDKLIIKSDANDPCFIKEDKGKKDKKDKGKKEGNESKGSKEPSDGGKKVTKVASKIATKAASKIATKVASKIATKAASKIATKAVAKVTRVRKTIAKKRPTKKL
jgi:hypothetical protein